MAGINFKAFDLGGHEIARRVWKDYYAKVGRERLGREQEECQRWGRRPAATLACATAWGLFEGHSKAVQAPS